MDLKQLQELGGIVPPTPVEQTVSWTRIADNGEEVTETFAVRIKKLSAGEMERLWDDARANPSRSHMAALIAASLHLGDDGKERISYDQAFTLDLTLMEALLDAVDKVNPFQRRKGKAPKN